MPDKMLKQIWALKSEVLFEKRMWNGLLTEDLEYYYRIIHKHGEFLERGPLETDPSYKQIIAQIVLRVGDKYLLHRITKSGSEERLHDMWPIPVGGHVELIDTVDDEKDILETAMMREFMEEVNYKGQILDKKFIGLIYVDDGNVVNSVHVGALYLFIGDTEKIDPHEDCITDMRFLTLDELNEMKNQTTYWSQAILPELNRIH